MNVVQAPLRDQLQKSSSKKKGKKNRMKGIASLGRTRGRNLESLLSSLTSYFARRDSDSPGQSVNANEVKSIMHAGFRRETRVPENLILSDNNGRCARSVSLNVHVPQNFARKYITARNNTNEQI